MEGGSTFLIRALCVRIPRRRHTYAAKTREARFPLTRRLHTQGGGRLRQQTGAVAPQTAETRGIHAVSEKFAVNVDIPVWCKSTGAVVATPRRPTGPVHDLSELTHLHNGYIRRISGGTRVRRCRGRPRHEALTHGYECPRGDKVSTPPVYL